MTHNFLTYHFIINYQLLFSKRTYKLRMSDTTVKRMSGTTVITWKWLSEQSDEYKLRVFFTHMWPKKHIKGDLPRFVQAYIKTPSCIDRTRVLEIITMYMKYRHWSLMKSS